MITPNTIAQEASRLPIGLFYGRLGVSACLANTDRKLAAQLASNLGDDIVRLKCDTSLRHGLCGVVMGIEILRRNGVDIGDISQLKEETDALVFRNLTNQSYMRQLSVSSLVEYLCYESWRLGITSVDTDAFYCHTELLKTLALALVKALLKDSLMEPATYSLEYVAAQALYGLSIVTSHGVYKEHVEKTLDELSPLFLYKMPILHSNRLYLLWALSRLLSVCRPNEEWCEYLVLLKGQISIDRVLAEVDGAVYMADGAASIYFLLKETSSALAMSQESMHKYATAIYGILTNSREIKHLEGNPAYLRNHLGLYDGFAGVALARLAIEKTYQL